MAALNDLDLRGIPVWERPNAVREALDRLPSGGSLSFITENEPRGLSGSVVQEHPERFVVETRRVAHGIWRVRLTPRQGNGARHTPLAHLERCAAFAFLGAAAREALARAAIVQTGRRGQTLVGENADWPYIGVVVEGTVARERGGDGQRERILYEIPSHDLFGVAEYFDRGLKMARIVVFSKAAKILKLPWEDVSRVAAEHPELTNALGIVLAQRLRRLADALSAQGSVPILGRIARVLLPYAMPERGLVPAAPSLATITQSQIAASAGTVKEVAARAIAELESRRVLRRERGHIRYLDREHLVELIREVS